MGEVVFEEKPALIVDQSVGGGSPNVLTLLVFLLEQDDFKQGGG